MSFGVEMPGHGVGMLRGGLPVILTTPKSSSSVAVISPLVTVAAVLLRNSLTLTQLQATQASFQGHAQL